VTGYGVVGGADGGLDPQVVPEPPDLRLALPTAVTWVALLLAPRWSGRCLLLAAGVTALAGLLALGSRRRSGSARLLAAAVLLCLSGGLVAVGLRVVARAAGPVPGLASAGAGATLEAVLTGDPRLVATAPLHGRPAGTLHVVQARAETVRVGRQSWRVRQPVLVLAGGPGWDRLLPSQRVRLAGRLGAPRPGDDVVAVVRVRGSPDLLGHPSALQAAAGRLRAGLRSAASGLPPAEAGLLPGLVDGDTAGLDPQLADAFRVTGLTHLVAVSGSNCVAVLAAALLLARSLRLGHRSGHVAAGLLLVAFVVLARPSPSVLRAAVMGLLGVAAVATGRARPALPALAATVLGLLLLDPDLARSPGFALSSLASGALLVLAPGWRAALTARGVRPALAEALAVPLAAQLVCGPVIAIIAGSVSLVAVPANLLAVPAVPAATVLGVLAAVSAPVSPLVAHGCAQLAGLPCRWLVAVARLGAAAPGASVPWPSGAGGGLLLAGATVLGVATVRRRRGRRWLALGGAVAAALAWSH